jgi:beta-lactamase regulating signal transducer with metallopeptidase domain
MTPQLLLESALRAAVLGAGVWALLRVLRIRNSAREWVIWLAVLAAALLMPFVAPEAKGLLPQAIQAVSAPSIVDRISAVSGGVLSRVVGSHDTLRNTAALLWPVYLSVAALLITRLGIGLLLMRRMWLAAIPVPVLSANGVTVRSTDRIDAPAVTGNGILLPSDWTTWSRQTLECVLVHERSHHSRNDFHWQLLTRLHLAIFWVSPFAWWLLRRITILAEYLSDEAVVEAQGNASEYAEMLLRFAGGRRTALLTVGMARRATLTQRIERILSTQPTRPQRHSSMLTVIGVVAISATSAVNPWFQIDSASADRGSIVPRSEITELQRTFTLATTSPAEAAGLRSGPPAPRSPIPRVRNTRRLRRPQPMETARLAPLTESLGTLTALRSDAGTALSGRLQPLATPDATAERRGRPR